MAWGSEMTTMRVRPYSATRGAEPCVSCGARSSGICAAIEEQDLERLAALATPLAVSAGRTFITEGDPAEHFFTMTSGTAKLFKLLPDGRRQITGFASVGTFLGLAVSSSYAFNAEAVEDSQVCRFSRIRLRGLIRVGYMEALLSAITRNILSAWRDGGPKPKVAEGRINHQ